MPPSQKGPLQESQAVEAKVPLMPELKTVGCFNLGNTCYINSVIQCVANTHYFKDYFLRSVFEKKRELIMSNDAYYDLQLIFNQ